ncbi:MAG: RnfABCDGE type electron transport complex subunit D [Spirochaetales bacterium]|uniref:Ion-translocating oxidoreductase complex subunit D n=1 Tax=Candidatus Thalassospirochaeta sargassi TaxID=3119039 RepID=A0AAJ1II17_9SPIO|nr:RnfABCDGE type electron transport complex subunit D [Spirochaetales bacterium]
MSEEMKLKISSSPQIHSPASTAKIMWIVVVSLIPAGVWGVYAFGPRSILVLAASILAAVASEYLMGLVFKKSTLADGSAVLTGLLIGYNMPAEVPIYIAVLASVFAIVIVKWTFGGLGTNWMNPALAGRVFVFFSWTGGMSRWSMPHMVPDTVSGASPLGFLKTNMMTFSGTSSGPMDFLAGQNYPVDSYMDLFIGRIPGCIGEVSALLLLIGGIFLIILKIVNWEIPVFYIGSFALLTWIFGGMGFGNGFFSGDILFHLFTGGLMLGALFMATDMVTSPITRKGMIIYAIGCGFLTFLIRFYGSFPEGVSLAIILMNIFVPLINRATQPVKFGNLPKEKKND